MGRLTTRRRRKGGKEKGVLLVVGLPPQGAVSPEHRPRRAGGGPGVPGWMNEVEERLAFGIAEKA